MKITMQTKGLEKVQKLLASLSGPQVREAQAKAINDTAYQVRRSMQNEFNTAFDRVTPYILKSASVKQATPDNLVATIEPTYYGGKGIDPQLILRAQEAGGTRRDKRSETALRRAGILPGGYQTAIPETPFPGSDDGKGNIKGSFIVQLISYFQAFGEQGYRANMTDKRKKNIQKGNAKQAGRRYFVTYGKLRSDPKSSHLPAGIWAASGTHGSNVQPVLMFVKSANYKPRIAKDRILKAADIDNYLPRRMRYRIRQAAGV